MRDKILLGAFYCLAFPAFLFLRLLERTEAARKLSAFEMAQKLRRSQERAALDIQRVRARVERRAL